MKMYQQVPPILPPGALHIQYRCDHNFAITNTSDEPVLSRYTKLSVAGKLLPGGLGLAPHTTQQFTMPSWGTIQIIDNGKVIAQVTPTEKSCAQYNKEHH
jgi:hypothetical protein